MTGAQHCSPGPLSVQGLGACLGTIVADGGSRAAKHPSSHHPGELRQETAREHSVKKPPCAMETQNDAIPRPAAVKTQLDK